MASKFSNKNSEKGLCAAIYHNPEIVYSYIDQIRDEDFAFHEYRAIFQSLKELIIEDDLTTLDTISLETKCKNKEEDYIELFQNGAVIQEIDDKVVSKKGSIQFARDMKQRSVARGISRVMQRNLASIEESVGKVKTSELISTVEESFYKYITGLSNGRDTRMLCEGFEEWANELADNPIEQVGIPTPFPLWDEAIGGLRKSSVTVIGARPKAGKSQIALYVGQHVALTHKLPVLVLDTELDFETQRMRLHGMVAGIKYEEIERGTWKQDKEKRAKINKAIKKLKDSTIYHIPCAGAKLHEIISLTRKFLVQKVGRTPSGEWRDCLVIYDYIKVMDAMEIKKDLAEWQLLGFFMSKLHDFASINRIPVLVTSQMNRNNLIASSDRILWLASSVSMLERKTPEEIEIDGADAGNAKLCVTHSRFGKGTDADEYISLHIDTAMGSFSERGLFAKIKENKGKYDN